MTNFGQALFAGFRLYESDGMKPDFAQSLFAVDGQFIGFWWAEKGRFLSWSKYAGFPKRFVVGSNARDWIIYRAEQYGREAS